MQTTPTDLSSPVNHVFLDFENVHEVDLAVLGNTAVHFTLLLGACQTKLDVSLVEKLLEHAASVQLVRLNTAGRNALDFTLAYYVGRAVAADPTGYFHIISRDTGYDALIEHLKSKHIRARRHASFAAPIFSGLTKHPGQVTSSVPPRPKPMSKSKASPAIQDERATQIVEHLRKASTTRPRNKKRLVSYLVAHLGHKLSEVEVLNIVKSLQQAGQLAIDDKDKVTYHLGQN